MAASAGVNITSLSSPTLSATSSTSSYDVVSFRSRSSTISSQELERTPDDDSDDEIVWGVSGPSLQSSQISELIPPSEDDFVVLNGDVSPRRLPSQSGNQQAELVARLDSLIIRQATASKPSTQLRAQATAKSAVSGNKKRRKRNPASRLVDVRSSSTSSLIPERPSSVATLTKSTVKPSKKKPKKSKKSKSKTQTPAPATGLGARPIVDDISVSEVLSESGESVVLPSMYDEAVTYITSFLSNPTEKDSVCHLTLLQSLIIELGLASSTLPVSLTSAKAILKRGAFLNIREYLAVREEGPAAVQRIMHPSRSALIKDIKKKRNPASLKWVKKHGLQVFLVSCFR
ncbi:hypothetical protein BD779DRAFT_1196545 [Infundibulicybe gibba]|nr:hypothetical protein BD779DRAFT_1196545 [Infundibulicybe gibba]